MIRTIAAAVVLSLTMSVLPACAPDDKSAGNIPPATTAPGAVADNLIWGD